MPRTIYCRYCENEPVYRDSSYCSKTCAKKAVVNDGVPRCILCTKYPKSNGQFCGRRCAEIAAQEAPIILRIPRDDPKFKDIETQFYASWRHGDKDEPLVRKIYKIIQTDELMERYYDYRYAAHLHSDDLA
ncbi:hypothetical protein FRB94_004828 [Tulasnella sp. JGI-2019a]|nr:hypothetical protein FRB93_002970 [Tulasnella sp. JGI-2019a]KAG9001335.1 hypothetical protein FRB94_004828 [Tulasnella sp. JGI-2019a]KAG9030060.1 hypothetical protein FRB95_004594 [Tulasnella sp. JGI-2019a]